MFKLMVNYWEVMIMEEKASLQRAINKEEKNSFKSILNKFFTRFMVLSLSMMVILVFINAIMRYIFKTSLPVSEEYSRFFFMWTTFLGVIAAFKDKQHVAVTIVIDQLKGKTKRIFYVIAQIISLIAMIIVLIGGIKYTISASTYKTVATGINFGIIASGIVVMVAGSIGIIIYDTYNTLKEETKGE